LHFLLITILTQWTTGACISINQTES